jgi:sodium bicarbonate cotransporter 8/sodium bicarbonate transporter 10
VGIWTAGFLLLMVIFNLSALVRYLTRFTEESFACLIALIFIVESFSKLAEIANEEPLQMHADYTVVSIVLYLYLCLAQ